uniref:Uncharacterized protein n=1 Tax=Arundo donax TaxID=35708 RepID=A0A0A9ADM7_ARUDO
MTVQMRQTSLSLSSLVFRIHMMEEEASAHHTLPTRYSITK